jgi:hypothetical protein
MKACTWVPELTITKDDADLVTEKVQDRTKEAWYDVEKQREEIINKLTEVKDTLEQLQLTIVQQKEQEKQQQTSKEMTVPEHETVQIIAMGSEHFYITQGMLLSDEDTTHKPLKDIHHLDLALPKVPTKALYKLQISVMQEIQSRAHADDTSLQLANEVKKTLEMTLYQVHLRGKKQINTGIIDQQVEEVFKTILDSTQGGNIPTEEKIEKIMQAMETYRSHIT